MSGQTEHLAILGHDLRTPICGMIGMTDLLLMTKVDAEQREYLEAIRCSAEHLLRMSSDMLELSRVDREPAGDESVQFSLRKTLHLTLLPLRHRAARKGVTLGYNVGFDVPDRLAGDPGRLTRLLVNLIGNAIKFTDQGRIEVGVERDDSGGREGSVKFTVLDTGIGISHDKIDRIFEPYYQVTRDGARNASGTGLGLAIASRLAEALHGRIWVESEPGRGSRFHFTGRFRPVEAPACKALAAG